MAWMSFSPFVEGSGGQTEAHLEGCSPRHLYWTPGSIPRNKTRQFRMKITQRQRTTYTLYSFSRSTSVFFSTKIWQNSVKLINLVPLSILLIISLTSICDAHLTYSSRFLTYFLTSVGLCPTLLRAWIRFLVEMTPLLPLSNALKASKYAFLSSN